MSWKRAALSLGALLHEEPGAKIESGASGSFHHEILTPALGSGSASLDSWIINEESGY